MNLINGGNLTNSGIDPLEVKNLVGRIGTFRTSVDKDFRTIEEDIKGRINKYYGGEAASSLMSRLQNLMDATRTANDDMIYKTVTDINDDLSDTQKTDKSLGN